MTEDLVRDAFRQQERQVDGWQAELGPAVRRKIARRRAAKWWIAGGLTLVATLGGSAAGLALGRGQQQAPPPAAIETVTATATSTTSSAQWRLESSLGTEAEIPADWGTNDFGCNMTAAPTVVRGEGPALLCLTAESPTKEVAIFGSGQMPETLAGNPTSVTINGVPAKRSGTVLDNGRYHGWIHVPSLDMYLVVRTLKQATIDHILDSLRIADPDHLGCPAARPPVAAQEAPAGGGLVPPVASSLAICRYGPRGRLEASASIAAQQAESVIAALNSAPQGRNPDPGPDQCIDVVKPDTDVVLLVTAGAKVTRVWITFGYCTGRGMTNGVGQANVSNDLIHAVMRPLKVGYAIPNGPGK